MARSMKLFLIRHGETVDNVAGLYAGIRDSDLTNHGYQQATRLGLHLKASGLLFTRLFSSHLQRAAKTAGKIREAQLALAGEDKVVPDVVQLPLLVEQNFGSMEGKKSYKRPPESKLAGKDHHRQKNQGTVGFVDVESKGAMAQRADTFLDTHLLPLLDDTSGVPEMCVALVSHGIFLSTLWKRLLLRLPSKSVVLSPELRATGCPSPEQIGGWSNTGYLELHMTQSVTLGGSAEAVSSAVAPVPCPSPAETLAADEGLGKAEMPSSDDNCTVSEEAVVQVPVIAVDRGSRVAAPRMAHGWQTTIQVVNGTDHLKGLKRTGGGVGSSRHDTSQKSIKIFFKRRKLG